MKILNRSKYLIKGNGFLLHKYKDNSGEIIKSISISINYKMLIMIATCETYWYDTHKDNRIRLRIKNKELILGKIAIKI